MIRQNRITGFTYAVYVAGGDISGTALSGFTTNAGVQSSSYIIEGRKDASNNNNFILMKGGN